MRSPLACLLLALVAPLTAHAQKFTNGEWVYTTNFQYGVTSANLETYLGAGGHVNVPASIGGVPVTQVNGHNMSGNLWGTTYGSSNTTVSSMTIPEGVLSVGGLSRAFNLTNVNLPNTVTSIGFKAFAECTNLTTATLPAGLTYIGFQAFSNCVKLAGITIPAGVCTIDTAAFYNCDSLSDVVIPSGVQSIGNSAFQSCGITNLQIAVGATNIGTNAFSQNWMTRVNIPASVIHIQTGAFAGCQVMTNLTFGNGSGGIALASIGETAFQTTAITSVTLPFTSAGRIAIATNAFPFPNSQIYYDYGSLATLTAFIDALAQNEAFVAAVASRIMAATNNYGLATKSDLSVVESNTVSAVQSDPTAYGLYDQGQVDLTYSNGVAVGTALVVANPGDHNLYSSNAIMDMAVGGLMVKKQGDHATISFQTQTTTDLALQPFTDNGPPITNQVLMPASKGFVRVRATAGQATGQ